MPLKCDYKRILQTCLGEAVLKAPLRSLGAPTRDLIIWLVLLLSYIRIIIFCIYIHSVCTVYTVYVYCTYSVDAHFSDFDIVYYLITS